MITEDYVSFETAKLLKEKGFNEICHSVYDDKGLCSVASLNRHYECGYGDLVITYQNTDYDDWENKIAAPTLQMAMKWLRETHNIDISVVPHPNKEDKTFDYEFVYWNGGEIMPYDEKRPTYHELFEKTWEKYEEACEAAIKYCLENLI